MSDTHRISISFTDEQYAFIKQIAETKGISAAECVRGYIFEKTAPEVIRKDNREVMDKLSALHNDVVALLLRITDIDDVEIKFRVIALNNTVEDIAGKFFKSIKK